MPTGPPRNPPPPCPRRSSISSVDPPGVHFIYVTSPWLTWISSLWASQGPVVASKATFSLMD